MRIWLALTGVLLTVLVIYNLENKDSEPANAPAPISPPVTQVPAATIIKPRPLVIHRRSEHSSENVIVESPAPESAPESVMLEQSAPESAIVETPFVQPPADIPLDLVSLKPGKPADPDPIMQLRSTEIVRPNDGPTITLTYGDVPKLNLKVEHRSWTTDPQTHSASGTVATDDTTGAP